MEAGVLSAENRLKAYIFPRDARTEADRETLRAAAGIQYEYEHSGEAAQRMMEAPAGLQSFSVGHFSASFEKGGRRDGFFPIGISPDAHALLLREGLLFRGVEGETC